MIISLFIAAGMGFTPDTSQAQKTISTTVNKQIAQETAASMAAHEGGGTSGTQEMMLIAPNDRAGDLLEAYIYLKQCNVASSISVSMKDKSVLSNILDMQLMKNGTLIVFKISTLQGEKYRLVKTEDIDALVVL
ncbi:MAG: hypothetical protein KBC64_04110 [Simkaniaceae bacterium]|nr:hypothetical protein [Simkaniaceae bacterium]